MALTLPPDLEAAFAALIGATNYVPGSLDVAFVNSGPTTVRCVTTYTVESTDLIATYNTWFTTTTDPTQTGTTDTTS